MSGYLTVYLDEKTETQCLYPSSEMPAEFEGGVPVEADTKYILFSKETVPDYFKGKNINMDEYELESKSSQDMNRLFIIYSKSPLNKPSLSVVKEIENEYTLPKSLPSEDFQRWLNKHRSMEKSNMQVEIVDITITK
jgi:hypothetical protein